MLNLNEIKRQTDIIPYLKFSNMRQQPRADSGSMEHSSSRIYSKVHFFLLSQEYVHQKTLDFLTAQIQNDTRFIVIENMSGDAFFILDSP
jgi:hypothetical protein